MEHCLSPVRPSSAPAFPSLPSASPSTLTSTFQSTVALQRSLRSYHHPRGRVVSSPRIAATRDAFDTCIPSRFAHQSAQRRIAVKLSNAVPHNASSCQPIRKVCAASAAVAVVASATGSKNSSTDARPAAGASRNVVGAARGIIGNSQRSVGDAGSQWKDEILETSLKLLRTKPVDQCVDFVVRECERVAADNATSSVSEHATSPLSELATSAHSQTASDPRAAALSVLSQCLRKLLQTSQLKTVNSLLLALANHQSGDRHGKNSGGGEIGGFMGRAVRWEEVVGSVAARRDVRLAVLHALRRKRVEEAVDLLCSLAVLGLSPRKLAVSDQVYQACIAASNLPLVMSFIAHLPGASSVDYNKAIKECARQRKLQLALTLFHALRSGCRGGGSGGGDSSSSISSSSSSSGSGSISSREPVGGDLLPPPGVSPEVPPEWGELPDIAPGVAPDMFTYRSMMDVCAACGAGNIATEIIQAMVEEDGVVPNTYVVNSALNACISDWDATWSLWFRME
ncbi:unnamed protein product, partial [Closterium sp. Yama58-4]